MADDEQTLSDFSQLGEAAGAPGAPGAAAEVPHYEPEIDAHGRSYGTGRRKESVARVWIKPGTGKMQVNGQTLADYFVRPVLQMMVQQPFGAANREGQFDAYITVKGGGLAGQAGAIRHGMAQALSRYEPGLRPVLKQQGMLTRDSRKVERKKYGRPKARRSSQFSKR